MRKKFTMLLALMLCAFASSAVSQTYYKPGERTTTLVAGKRYFISAATFYGSARTNLLYNNNDARIMFITLRISKTSIGSRVTAHLWKVRQALP